MGKKNHSVLEGVWNFVLIAGIIGAILWSKSLADGPFKDHSVAEKNGTANQNRRRKDGYHEGKNSKYMSRNAKNDTTVKFDKSNHEYYELRGNHLHAKAEVNRLRAQKSHDENRGISIFGVTVPYFNLVRDGLLILIAFISLLYTPMYTVSPRHDSEHEHDHPEPRNTSITYLTQACWKQTSVQRTVLHGGQS